MAPIRTRNDRMRLVRLASAFDQEEQAAEFVLPENLADLDNEALAALEQEAVEAFDATRAAGADRAHTQDDLDTMEALADAVDLIRAEQNTRAEVAEANAERAAELAARVTPEATADEDGEEGDEGEEPEATADEEAVAEEPQEVVAEEREPQPVAASSRRSRPSRIPLRQAGVTREAPAADEDQGPVVSLVAAAGDSEVNTGASIDMDTLAAMVARRFRSLPPGGSNQVTFGLGSFHKPLDASLIASGEDASEVAAHAASERRLPGGSLIAAGGWCAPSETMYDQHCQLESTDGMIDLPEMGTSRGGVRYFRGIDFGTIYETVPGFSYTEQEDIDGDYDGNGGGSKPCVTIPCDDPEECRLGLHGFCLRSGLLQERAYPELNRRFLEGALVAHGHRINVDVLEQMKADATHTVNMPADTGGAIAPLLAAVELQITDFRTRHRMPKNATLEVIFPEWTFGPLRSDLSKRLGIPWQTTTNAMIQAELAERNARAQFVYGFDDAFSGGAAIGGATPATQWPDTIPFLLYPAGTYTKVTQQVITVEGLLDSTLLERNERTAIFTEEAYCVIQTGCDSRLVNVPICADGSTQAGVDLLCEAP